MAARGVFSAYCFQALSRATACQRLTVSSAIGWMATPAAAKTRLSSRSSALAPASLKAIICSPTASMASCWDLLRVSQTALETMIGSMMKKKLWCPGVVMCLHVSCSLKEMKLLELVHAASMTPVCMPR